MKINLRTSSAFAIALMTLLSTSTAGWADIADDKAFLEAQRQAIENEDKAAVEAQRIAIEAESSLTTNPKSKNGPLLKGGVTYCVPSGTPLKMKLASVPTNGMKMLDRDMDGKLHPAMVNQEITAKISEDIFIDDNNVIPQGTIFHGYVTNILPPRRVGRPGSLEIKFDNFKLPDGRRFAFRAQADNFRKSTAKSKAKGFGLIAAHAAGGAIVGALITYRLFGLEQTIAMDGYNIAGGAAIGALGGIATALLRKGADAVLEPGDELNMEIDRDLLMPAATNPTIKPPPTNLPGLDLKILKTKMMKDGLDGHQLRVEMVIHNNTRKRLNSIDLFVEDDNGGRFPIVGDIDAENTQILFDVDPQTTKRVMCDFQYEFPKLNGKIVWLDHGTRQPLVEVKFH